MKKFILMSTFMLLVIVANAQLSWTVRAGINASGIENSDSQMKLGWKVGAGVDYSFSKLFSIRPMLYYTTKGCSYDGNTFGFFPDEFIRLGYLELPVMASFHFKTGQKTSLAANVGPYFGYRITEHSSQSFPKFNNFDMGMTAGVDFTIKKFVIGAEAQYGFTSIKKESAGNLHNINYSLVFGYKF